MQVPQSPYWQPELMSTRFISASCRSDGTSSVQGTVTSDLANVTVTPDELSRASLADELNASSAALDGPKDSVRIASVETPAAVSPSVSAFIMPGGPQM